MQRLKPLLVRALVAQLAVEALDEAVLHRLARLDQQMPDFPCPMRPSHERPASELRSVANAE